MSTVVNSQPILCCYTNQTQSIQVAKLISSTSGNREKVVFPGEKFLFETTTNNKVDIYISLAGESILLDSILCSTLQTETPYC